LQVGDVAIDGGQPPLAQIDIAGGVDVTVGHAQFAQAGNLSPHLAIGVQGLFAAEAGNQGHLAGIQHGGDGLAGGGRPPVGQVRDVAAEKAREIHQTVFGIPQGVAVDHPFLAQGAPSRAGVLVQGCQGVGDVVQLLASGVAVHLCQTALMGDDHTGRAQDHGADQKCQQCRRMPPAVRGFVGHDGGGPGHMVEFQDHHGDRQQQAYARQSPR
jgi:hypothetical protein